MLSAFLFVLAFLSRGLLAATVTYNWNIGWTNANPDGQLVKPTIGINGVWPCPPIIGNVGDQIVINLQNNLGNETTTLHFHGLLQAGTNYADGPSMVTQCPVVPGGSYTYSFTLKNPGTYWYHAHVMGQVTDGLRGPIVVHDPNSPYAKNYTAEIVLTISDWYHDQMPTLIPYYLSPQQNPDGGEPVPYSILFNEAQNIQFQVQPSTTYLVRIISMATFGQVYVHFDQHNLTIVETDGVYTRPRYVQDLYLAVAQRYSVLLTTKNTTTTNYGILGMLDTNAIDNIPSYLNPNVTGYLVYNTAAPLPPSPVVSQFNTIDDFLMLPYDLQVIYHPVNRQIVLNVSFFQFANQNRAGFNNITYVEQKVPTLYTAMSAPSKYVTNPAVYGVNSNPFVLNYGDVIELVIYNYDTGPHPMHLHGHQPQMVYRNQGAGSIGYNSSTAAINPVPNRRDTWTLQPQGVTVVRFVANNPGVWLCHCHMEWHVDAGLTATFIEAPTQLQQQQSIPSAAASQCAAQGIPTAGNAAGNTKNWLDLTGANTIPPPNPQGALYTKSGS